MKRNIIETVLGAVVLLIGAVFLIYASSAARTGDVSGYTIYATFNEIGALTKGNDVRIGGVKVGQVSDVTLDPESYHAKVAMTLSDDVKVPTDSNARIASESLMGGAYLAIDPGAEDTMMKKGDTIQFTQSPQNLEQLLGKFIFAVQDSKKMDDDKAADAPAAPAADTTAAPAPDAAPAPAEPAHP